MLLRLSIQIAVGVWLSAAVAAGILGRSLETSLNTLGFGMMFMAFALAVYGLQSPHVLRWLSVALVTGFIGMMLQDNSDLIEQLYLRATSEHPQWQRSGDSVR